MVDLQKQVLVAVSVGSCCDWCQQSVRLTT